MRGVISKVIRLDFSPKALSFTKKRTAKIFNWLKKTERGKNEILY